CTREDLTESLGQVALEPKSRTYLMQARQHGALLYQLPFAMAKGFLRLLALVEQHTQHESKESDRHHRQLGASHTLHDRHCRIPEAAYAEGDRADDPDRREECTSNREGGLAAGRQPQQQRHDEGARTE